MALGWVNEASSFQQTTTTTTTVMAISDALSTAMMTRHLQFIITNNKRVGAAVAVGAVADCHRCRRLQLRLTQQQH